MAVSGQLHALAVLLTGKEYPVPIGYEAGWAREPVWTLWGSHDSYCNARNNRDMREIVLCVLLHKVLKYIEVRPCVPASKTTAFD
jgi:hypothetical protein